MPREVAGPGVAVSAHTGLGPLLWMPPCKAHAGLRVARLSQMLPEARIMGGTEKATVLS